MKVLKTIGIIVALIGLLAVAGFMMQKDVHVERSIAINSSKEVIMSKLCDFKFFNEWSPWAKIDPNNKVEYAGTDCEVGSSYSWKGNDEVGTGTQEITAMSDSKIDIKLVFTAPWESTSSVYYEVKEGEEGMTNVTWGYDGQMPMLMSMFMNMDEMLGGQYEEGLNSFKTLLDAMPKSSGNSEYTINEVDLGSRIYMAKRKEVSFSEMGAFYQENLPAIFEAAGTAGLTPSGAPAGIYYSYDEENEVSDMAAAIPVQGDENTSLEGCERIDVSGKALHVEYYGAYDNSMAAHMALSKHMEDNNLELNEIVINEYVTDPSEEADTSKWLTNIYYMVK